MRALVLPFSHAATRKNGLPPPGTSREQFLHESPRIDSPLPSHSYTTLTLCSAFGSTVGHAHAQPLSWSRLPDSCSLIRKLKLLKCQFHDPFLERLQESQESIQESICCEFDKLSAVLGIFKRLYSVDYIITELGFRDCLRPGYLQKPHAKCWGAIGCVFERFLSCFVALIKHFDGTTYLDIRL